MRRALVLVAVATAGALAQAAPAAADCNAALYLLTGRCENACTLVADAYHTLGGLAGPLPDVLGDCPQ